MILVMDMNESLKYSYQACVSKKVYAQYMTSIAYALEIDYFYLTEKSNNTLKVFHKIISTDSMHTNML